MPVVEVEGRRLSLSRLEKVLYPDGTAKGELLHYYALAGPALLPHLADRAVSFLRYPDGPEGETFFMKNPPPGTPDWVEIAEIPRAEGGARRQVVLRDMPSLMWAANLVVEFHTYQWPAARPGIADRLVFDLDPGAPAALAECCLVARWLRDRLAADGIAAYPKTSGSKGLHLLSPIEPAPSSRVRGYARELAGEASAAFPDLAITAMARHLRPGKVFIDHSQNAAAKTTAAPYTARARRSPTVSAPVTWEEVEDAEHGGKLVVTIADVPGRLAAHGDLMAPLTDPQSARPLPG